MKRIKSVSCFKEIVAPTLTNYRLSYRFFPNGDFGTLDEVEIESEKISCAVNFWGLGWLGIHIFDYQKEEEVLNILLEPNEETEKESAFKKMLEILKQA